MKLIASGCILAYPRRLALVKTPPNRQVEAMAEHHYWYLRKDCHKPRRIAAPPIGVSLVISNPILDVMDWASGVEDIKLPIEAFRTNDSLSSINTRCGGSVW